MTRVLLLGAIFLFGCDCEGVTGQLCDGDNPPTGCGTDCDDTSPCLVGLYCSGDSCTSDCRVDGDCGANQRCNAGRGQCLNVPPPGSDGSTVDGEFCADVNVSARMVTPKVMLIVDQSGSMTENFSRGRDRWTALRESLMNQPDGLVDSLQGQVEFGLALYSGTNDNPVCPLIETVPVALNNYDAISRVYSPADPLDDTPTGDAIDAVAAMFTSDPDPDPDPIIFIVATDGEPDRCEELDPQNGHEEAISAAARAYDAGIRTFMISVGEGVISDAHMTDMANAGAGVAGGAPDAPFWIAGDDALLRDALTEIVGGVLSCDVVVSGEIDLSMTCAGTVRLNGVPLACDDPNGWRATSASRIEILGDACDTLLEAEGATLEASFPCNAILI